MASPVARWVLPVPGGPQHVVPGGDEVEGAQVGDQLAFEPAGVVEVEVLQALAPGEAGGPDPAFSAVAVSGGDFALQAGHEELLVRPVLRPGALGEAVDAVTQGGCLQRPGQERDLRTEVPGRSLGGHQATCSSVRPKTAS